MRQLFYSSLIVIVLLFLAGQFSNAATISELQDKIDESTRAKEALEKEIAGYQKQLDVVNAQANNLQNTIKSLDLSAKKLESEIKLTRNNIEITSISINNTGVKINDQSRQITKDELAIRNTLRRINQLDNQNIIELILGHNTISDFSNDLEAILKLQEEIRKKVSSLKITKSALEDTKISLENKKRDLEEYQADLGNQQAILNNTKKEKNTLLAQTQNTQANYNKILADKKALMDAFDAELANYEAQLRLAIDPRSFPKAGRGILSWPVDNVIITQKFGYTSFAKSAYASGYHNGLDFGVSIGTKIRSAGSGVVEAVGDTDVACKGASFGKWVFIRYDNGLASTYAHLSLISSKAGQRVRAGDVVGYSGNTGYSTGPHLHMSLYAGQGVKVSSIQSKVCKSTYTMPIADPKAYLDPLTYL